VSDAPSTTTTDVLEGVDLSGRTVVVTGATAGIGRETARALAAAGASVVITARSDEKGAATVAGMRERVPGADVSYEVLELGSLDSVRAFTDRFTATHDRLDVLIGNAGIMAVPFGRTDDGFELQFGTNHLGHFTLVGRLLPLLVASAPSRVVLLSSGGHMASDIIWDDPNFESHDYNKMDAYGQSKTANILHAVELERRYGPLGVHAYAVHPGMVATQLARNFTPDVMEDLKARAKAAPSGGLPATVGVDVGAATSVWAATTSELDAEGGSYLADCAVATAAPYATDLGAAARLWALSEELVGETFPDPSVEPDA
jgi:NAD(P)-dependent dehydrogenase (short-subunit alcohol dehydrogenase family)